MEGETAEDRREQELLKNVGNVPGSNVVISDRPILKMPPRALDILQDARDAIAEAKRFTNRGGRRWHIT